MLWCEILVARFSSSYCWHEIMGEGCSMFGGCGELAGKYRNFKWSGW